MEELTSTVVETVIEEGMTSSASVGELVWKSAFVALGAGCAFISAKGIMRTIKSNKAIKNEIKALEEENKTMKGGN